MPAPKCPACGSAGFASKGGKAGDYKFPLVYICCSDCGAVVGVLPHHDPGVLGQQNEMAIQALRHQVNQGLATLNSNLEALASRLRG